MQQDLKKVVSIWLAVDCDFSFARLDSVEMSRLPIGPNGPENDHRLAGCSEGIIRRWKHLQTTGFMKRPRVQRREAENVAGAQVSGQGRPDKYDRR